MKCARIKRLLPLLAGRELVPKDRRLVDEHIAVCPRCRETAKEYSALREFSRNAATEEMPHGFLDGFVRETVNLAKSDIVRASRATRPTLRPDGKRRRLAFAGAAFLVLLGAIFTYVAVDPGQLHHPNRPTLVDYLERSDFRGLAAALSNERAKVTLMKEPISVDLLVSAVERLHRQHSRHGHVQQYLASSLLGEQVGRRGSHEARRYPMRPIISPAFLCAAIEDDGISLEAVLRALKWRRQWSAETSLAELVSALKACRETYKEVAK